MEKNRLLAVLWFLLCVTSSHGDNLINIQEIYSSYPDTLLVFAELLYDVDTQQSYYSEVQNFTAIPQSNDDLNFNSVPDNININTIYSPPSSKIHVGYYYEWNSENQHLLWTFDTKTNMVMYHNLTSPKANSYIPMGVSLSNHEQQYPLYFVLSCTPLNTLNITVWNGENELNVLASLDDSYKAFVSDFLVREDDQTFFLTNAESEIFGTTSLLVGNFSSGAVYTVPLTTPSFHLIQIWDLINTGNSSLLVVFSTSQVICEKPSQSMLLFLGTVDIETGDITEIVNFEYYGKIPCKGFNGFIFSFFNPSNYTVSVLAPVGNIYLFWQVNLATLRVNYQAINIPNNNPVYNYYFMWSALNSNQEK